MNNEKQHNETIEQADQHSLDNSDIAHVLPCNGPKAAKQQHWGVVMAFIQNFVNAWSLPKSRDGVETRMKNIKSKRLNLLLGSE